MDALSKAVERMRELVRAGRDGGVAATIAEDEYGLDRGDIAKALAQDGAAIRARKRRERGVLTQDEVAELTKGRMTDPRFDPVVRRAVKLTLLTVMTQDRSVRNLKAELVERAEPLGDDQRLIYWHELQAIFGAMPADLDPREVRRTDLPRSSFLWPHLMTSPEIRWVSRG